MGIVCSPAEGLFWLLRYIIFHWIEEQSRNIAAEFGGLGNSMNGWHLTIDCLTNSTIIAKDLARDGVANESEFNGFLFNSMIE